MITVSLLFGSQFGMQCHLPLGAYDGDCPSGQVGGVSTHVTTMLQGMAMTPPSSLPAATSDALVGKGGEVAGASPSDGEAATSGGPASPPASAGAVPSPMAGAASTEPPPSGTRGSPGLAL